MTTPNRPPLSPAAQAMQAEFDGPAVPDGREPASVTGKPSDRELLELMPETMRDEFAYAAKICSEATGGQVKPRIFRVCLNTAALEYARAVHARWSRPTPAPAGEHQVAPVPVAVSERLPDPNVKVLAHYFNALGKGRTICAIWVPAKTRSDSYGNDDFTEYDEDSDTFYWPEGWYETIENWDDLGYVKVDEGEVVYWQPLPKWPTTALPLPNGKVES